MTASMTEPIRIWPGAAPGSEGWAHEEATATGPSGEVLVRNVVVPTMTPYMPDPTTACGTAMVVAPGGGFHFLSWGSEGVQVAEWLASRGVAAFVLKYRLVDTGPTEDDFTRVVSAWAQQALVAGGPGRVEPGQIAPGVWPLAAADGAGAVRVLRSGADEWGIDPGKIGFMGFSAGGFVTSAVALTTDASARPSFVAPIYGAAVNGEITSDAPPLFCVVAADDPLCLDGCVETFRAWRAAGRPAELHVYGQGGHGFGARKLGLPVDSWMERLADWMQAGGWLP